MTRTRRQILIGFATLGLGAAGLLGQAGSAYGTPGEPSIARTSSSAVAQTTATLDATIDPGEAQTGYHFEYGTSTAYGTSLPQPDAEIAPGSEANVGQELTGLLPSTTYHYRVVASSALGHALSADETFTTAPLQPPVVSTGEAVGVSQNTATLTGTIDPQGFETVYELDLGSDTSYGSRIFGDAGVELGSQTFAIPLEGLKSDTTYHYRLQATNAFGTSYGVDQAFTTAGYPSAVLTAPVAPMLVPAPLLSASSNSAGTAKAASVGLGGARAARRGRSAGVAGSRSSKHKPKVTSGAHARGIKSGRGTR